MRRAAIAIAVVACGAPASPRPALVVEARPPSEAKVAAVAPAPSCANGCAARRAAPSIYGVVANLRCEPIEGVTVNAYGEHGGAFADITDARGCYDLGPLPPGEYHVLAFYGDARVEHRGIPVRSDMTERVDVRLDDTPPPPADVIVK